MTRASRCVPPRADSEPEAEVDPGEVGDRDWVPTEVDPGEVGDHDWVPEDGGGGEPKSKRKKRQKCVKLRRVKMKRKL